MYVLITRDPAGGIEDVELFSERPQTWNDPSNWPDDYVLLEGDPDGGDTITIEDKVTGSPRLEYRN